MFPFLTTFSQNWGNLLIAKRWKKISHMDFLKTEGFISVYCLLSILIIYSDTASSQAYYRSGWRFPELTGQYSIGTTTFNLKDPTRAEVLSKDQWDIRELMIRIWYPIDEKPQEAPDTYFENYKQLGKIWNYYFPGSDSLFLKLQLTPTCWHSNVPISAASDKFPLILFSPGIGVTVPEDYSGMIIQLVSHGYIIVGISRPYESGEVIFPDGRYVYTDTLNLNRVFRDGDDIFSKIDTVNRPITPEEKDRFSVRIMHYVNSRLNVWIEDSRFVIDELERLNAGRGNTLFFNKIDLQRIGVYGHSFGGTTAGQLCLVDPRVKAGINVDGFQSGDLIYHRLAKPFMCIYAENSSGMNDDILKNSNADLYSLSIANTHHGSFSDNKFYMENNKIDGAVIDKIVNTYLLAFFDKYLKQKDSTILSEESKFSGVTFQKLK
jgi:predicted dienelactone hydrolase